MQPFLSEVILSQIYFSLGFFLLVIFERVLTPVTRVFLSIPVGLSLYVFSSIIYLTFFNSFNPLLSFISIFLIEIVFLINKRPPLKKVLLQFSLGSLFFVLFTVFLRKFNFSYVTYDSFKFIFNSWVLKETKSIDVISSLLSNYPIFIQIIHATANYLGSDFSYTFSPLIFFSSFFSSLLILFKPENFKNKIFIISVVVLLVFLVSSWKSFCLVFYINSQAAMASFFLLVLVSFSKLKEFGFGVFDFLIPLFVFSMSSLRLEGMIISFVFLVSICSLNISSKRKLFISFLSFFICFIWQMKISLYLENGDMVDQKKIFLMLLIIFIPSLIAFIQLKSRYFSFLAKYLDIMLFFFLLFFSFLSFFLKYNHMIQSSVHMVANLIFTSSWSCSWVSAIFFIFLCFKKNNHYFFRKNLILFCSMILTIFLFSYLRIPYRFGNFDSSSRMLFHIYPSLVIVGFFQVTQNFLFKNKKHLSIIKEGSHVQK